MAAPRKLPPAGALQTIEEMASSGQTIIGIAKQLDVSRETFKRWCDEDGTFQEAFEIGRDKHRQYLVSLIVEAAKVNKGANANAMFLLKTMHGFREFDSPNAKVDVNVAVANPVMIVRDHGDDATWAAKCAAQQRALTADCTSPLQVEASTTPQVDAVAMSEPPAMSKPQAAPVPVPAPVAPSWVAPVQQAAPVTAAPYYGPPVFDWQTRPVPEPICAREPIRTAPIPPVAAPVWRAKA